MAIRIEINLKNEPLNKSISQILKAAKRSKLVIHRPITKDFRAVKTQPHPLSKCLA